MTTLTLKDINTRINGEPRVHDLRLAKALGFERPVNIRLMIKRNTAGLQRFGTLFSKKRVIRGGEAVEYYLTERQALYLCTKSKAEKAIDLTIQMVELFYQLRNKALPAPKQLPCINPEQSRAAERVAELSERMIPQVSEMYARTDHLFHLMPMLGIHNEEWKKILEEAMAKTREKQSQLSHSVYLLATAAKRLNPNQLP